MKTLHIKNLTVFINHSYRWVCGFLAPACPNLMAGHPARAARFARTSALRPLVASVRGAITILIHGKWGFATSAGRRTTRGCACVLYYLNSRAEGRSIDPDRLLAVLLLVGVLGPGSLVVSLRAVLRPRAWCAAYCRGEEGGASLEWRGLAHV